MANKDPAFLFYSSDFITGCMGLTMEERGQYITLIVRHEAADAVVVDALPAGGIVVGMLVDGP